MVSASRRDDDAVIYLRKAAQLHALLSSLPTSPSSFPSFFPPHFPLLLPLGLHSASVREEEAMR